MLVQLIFFDNKNNTNKTGFYLNDLSKIKPRNEKSFDHEK
jgi:hypothetical protein